MAQPGSRPVGMSVNCGIRWGSIPHAQCETDRPDLVKGRPPPASMGADGVLHDSIAMTRKAPYRRFRYGALPAGKAPYRRFLC